MPEQHYHEQMIARLNELVRDRTLRSKFFGINGALFLDERRAYYFRKLGRRAESFSTRTSTYYAAASGMSARAKNSPLLLKPLWLLIGYTCLRRFIGIADALVREAGGFELLPANQADVYVHTLFARGRKRYDDALEYAGVLVLRPDASEDNRALMERIGAEIGIARGDYAFAHRRLSFAFAQRDKLHPLTIVRLLRTNALLHDQQGRRQEANIIWEDARRIAETHGFTGQLEKIKARQ